MSEPTNESIRRGDDLLAPSLTDFLLARIAEDEAWLAQQSGDLEWCQECAFGSQPESPYSLSRLTAECEAKRQIVTECRYWIEDDGHYGLAACESILNLLALPYANHSEYQEEWRP